MIDDIASLCAATADAAWWTRKTDPLTRARSIAAEMAAKCTRDQSGSIAPSRERATAYLAEACELALYPTPTPTLTREALEQAVQYSLAYLALPHSEDM